MEKTGNKKASVMEADILLSDAKSEYEDLFGTDIWNQSVGDVKFDEYVKEQVKAKLERVYCMNVLADKKGVVLSRNQKTAVSDAAEEYYNSLSDEKRNEFNITKEKLVNMFTSFAIADTLYNDLTDIIKEYKGIDEFNSVELFYPNFPEEVMDKSEEALYINSLLYYTFSQTDDERCKTIAQMIRDSVTEEKIDSMRMK